MIGLAVRKYRKRRVGALLLAVAVAGYLALPWIERKTLYPFPYRAFIEAEAQQRKVDPLLVAAVIRTESKFFPQAHSSRGAVGLMQLMPETARWIAGELGETLMDAKQLEQPAVNIHYGVWYLQSLHEEFSGNEVLLLAAYNAGRGNVRHWIDEYGWSEGFNDPDQLPYTETRAYVKKVLAARVKYKELY